MTLGYDYDTTRYSPRRSPPVTVHQVVRMSRSSSLQLSFAFPYFIAVLVLASKTLEKSSDLW